MGVWGDHESCKVRIHTIFDTVTDTPTDMSQLAAAHPAPGKFENVLSNWKWVKEITVHLSL